MRGAGRIAGRFGALAAVAAAAVLGSPALADAAGPTAVGVRVGNHPAFVRVVVDFTDAGLTANGVETTDPRPFDGTARLRVSAPGVASETTGVLARGVRVRVAEGVDRLRIAIGAAPRRFKYVSYAVVGGDRLAIDLWKSRSPAPAAEVRRGPRACLTLEAVAVTEGTIVASGREHALFEHGLSAIVRGAGGGIVGRRNVIAAGGRWSARVPYAIRHDQPGTIEAVAASAKDGSLACLVQARVLLLASP